MKYVAANNIRRNAITEVKKRDAIKNKVKLDINKESHASSLNLKFDCRGNIMNCC